MTTISKLGSISDMLFTRRSKKVEWGDGGAVPATILTEAGTHTGLEWYPEEDGAMKIGQWVARKRKVFFGKPDSRSRLQTVMPA